MLRVWENLQTDTMSLFFLNKQVNITLRIDTE